jgi:glutamyl/glutaminyl-tRNA synthetase
MAKQPYCVRFALPETAWSVRDALHGEVPALPDIMGDFVICRTDGVPTYLFASVADDHHMEISHVIRGDEHLPNALRQQALFDAMGVPAPVWVHIPMILGQDRHKLSKRTGSLPISEYREMGILPEALVNYLATLSWSGPPEDVSEIGLLAAQFSLSALSKSPPVHDETHLRFHQSKAVKQLSDRALFDLAVHWEPRLGSMPETLYPLLKDAASERPLLKELVENLDYLWRRPETDQREDWFGELADFLDRERPKGPSEIEMSLRSWQKERSMKPRAFFHPLRLALTAQEKGSPLPLVMAALGPDEVVSRLRGS